MANDQNGRAMDAHTAAAITMPMRTGSAAGGFLGGSRSGDRLVRKPKKIFDKDASIYGRWFMRCLQPATTRSIVTSPRPQRPAALIHDPRQHGEDVHLWPHA
jgi:hypothetical protein